MKTRGMSILFPTCELNDRLSFWSVLPAVLCISQHMAIEPTPSLCLAILRDSPNSLVLVGYQYTFSFIVPCLYSEPNMGTTLIVSQSWKKSHVALLL